MLEKADDTNDLMKLLAGEQIKTALLVIPLVGTLVAITFNIGYFYGIGMGYFSLFSLTEHIGFALEVLPIAFIVSIFGFMAFALLRSTGDVKKPTTSSVYREIGFTVGPIALGIGAWWLTHGAMFLWLTFLPIVWELGLRATKEPLKKRLVTLCCVTLMLYGVIFFFGIDFGRIVQLVTYRRIY